MAAIVRWYDRLAAFKVEDLFARKRQPGPQRIVVVNEDLPSTFVDKYGKVKEEHIYCSNQVITSKYTILTFVPRNLLEQFRRIANVFFLAIAILQFFNKFSTISPGLVIFPLLIVLAITALKDAYEDVKRHQSDWRVNHSHVRVLAGGGHVNTNSMGPKSKTFMRGILPKTGRLNRVKNKAEKEELKGVTSAAEGIIEYDDDREEEHPHLLHPRLFRAHATQKPHWKTTAWEDVRVGDYVKIKDRESLPADILICSTSEDENVAYVETKNLDGETNLKSRNAVHALTHVRCAADCASIHNSFRVECDKPDTSMFRLNAAVHVNKEVYPVDMQHVLLRGTVLKNTDWVIGIVLYTGEDTRIVMNAGGTPSKRSKVERQMNPQVFLNLIILAIMAAVCGIVDSVLEHRDQRTGALWLYGANRPGDNPSINGLVTMVFALITFQNIVPISLYISIEFVRTCQAAFIYFDSQIYYEKTGQATLARSWNLSDDLGQIEYIFSDKTGTLTQNSMVFQKCSIGGKVYDGMGLNPEQKKLNPGVVKEGGTPENAWEGLHPKSLPTDIRLSELRSSDSSTAVQPSLGPILASTSQFPIPRFPPSHPSGSSTVVQPSSEQSSPNPPTGLSDLNPLDATTDDTPPPHFYDQELADDISRAINADPRSASAYQARTLNGFFTVLSLCHTVLTTTNPETGKYDYKAQSPDEAALVSAAADMKFEYCGRDGGVLKLKTPFSAEEVEKYEMLNVLDFTSARKRMSVLVRKLEVDDNRIFLLCKGADNVIFERLKVGNERADAMKEVTERHLDEFASQGLRTLTLAFKVIPAEEYEAWCERYQAAVVAMDDREEKVERVSDEIEQDLRLLGATAIEDKLQDGVPETIADLKLAGIKIWVATGDKLETAIAIGHSTNLIANDSNIIVIRGAAEESTRSVWDQLVRAAQEFFPESNIVDDHGNVLDPVPASKEALSSGLESPNGNATSTGQNETYNLRRIETGLSGIVGHDNGDKPGGFILVIDGAALAIALSDEQHKSLLLRLSVLCEGTICCRVSPLQKALVVKLIKDGLGAMTLAIGDGANDVSMIQAADVGVGIRGEEGLQAVNSSDYAIAQFRFLKRLLLVHGHWSYARNGNMILNFFYKNIVCIGVLWWFQIYSGWSSNYVFEYTYLLFWNSFWTIAPVVAIGIFDRIIDASVLMELPELYSYGRQGKWFGMKSFVIYMLDGIVQSAIIFFLVLYTYWTTTTRSDGWQVSLYEMSTTMAFGAVLAANLFNGLNTSAWTGWVFFAVFIGVILIWVYTAIYNIIAPGWFVTPVYGNNNFIFESAYYWLCLPLVVLLSLAPRFLFKAYQFAYIPNDLDIVRYVHTKNPNYDFTQDSIPKHSGPYAGFTRPASVLSHRTESISSVHATRPSMDIRTASRTDMSTGARSIHRGFDFSTEENGVAMRRLQSNLSERRASSRNLALQQKATPERTPKPNKIKSFLRKASLAKDPTQ